MNLLDLIRVVEKELIFFVTGKGGVVGEEAQQAGQKGPPDD
jgi:hypothetical protein